jgi:hypothetical protein
MKYFYYIRDIFFSIFIIASFTSIFFTCVAYAKTNVRPISDFVSTQGSVLVDLGPTNGGELFGGKLFIWGNSLNQLFRVDYAGTDLKSLMSVGGPNVGTSYSGIIIEKSLSDGRAEVTINLVTHNAIVYMDNASTFPVNCSNGTGSFFTLCPAIFGYNIVELANGIGKLVLANSVMDIVFINTAMGAAIPDLTLLSFSPSSSGAYLKTLTLKVTSIGPLRSAFGVDEGTLGLAKLDVTIDTSKNFDDEPNSLKVLGK